MEGAVTTAPSQPALDGLATCRGRAVVDHGTGSRELGVPTHSKALRQLRAARSPVAAGLSDERSALAPTSRPRVVAIEARKVLTHREA